MSGKEYTEIQMQVSEKGLFHSHTTREKAGHSAGNTAYSREMNSQGTDELTVKKVRGPRDTGSPCLAYAHQDMVVEGVVDCKHD